ncbi:MAG: sigma-70 family RNA polymerase sigma factor [Okeania sp. SIO2H7]|nr:sigma-70 family RNA polymerase sigma factor [Okeania sp. SIO2H7]
MPTLDQTLRKLIAEAQVLSLKSLKRQQLLQKIYRLVMKSGKLWREYVPYYGDAVQQMWEYCCQHLDEYDPEVGAVISWFNFRLKKELRRLRDQHNRRRDRTASTQTTSHGDVLDPVDRLPSRPNIDPVLDILEKTVAWVNADPEGELRATRFRKRSDINAQVLFLKRFPSETPWNEIAADLGLNAAESKDLPKFYNRRCLPLLRKFGVSQGYIEESGTDRPREGKGKLS